MTDHLFMFQLRQNAKVDEPETDTSIDQEETERIVQKAFKERLGECEKTALSLAKLAHISYLNYRLVTLPSSFDCLDASQCWLAYWIAHSLTLLNSEISERHKQGLIRLLQSCQPPSGGFGGGPHQYSHLATTYGAVNCLCLLQTEEALAVIDRPSLRRWLLSLRRPDGAFRMHVSGEVDVRGCYCAISVASLTGILDEELVRGTAEWIASCQTYEGGFGGCPGLEAHGGYAFCAFASLMILEKTRLIDVRRLLHWAAMRQMSAEGGFQGRTNKLVDSCYSFWVGGLFPLLHRTLADKGDAALSCDDWLYHTTALQEYLLICCQKLPQSGSSTGGGMIDKPGKNVDPYHTCYSLSGLSVAQHFDFGELHYKNIVGDEENQLDTVDPRHNIATTAVLFARGYFQRIGPLVDTK